jgi:hypothetical protein
LALRCAQNSGVLLATLLAADRWPRLPGEKIESISVFSAMIPALDPQMKQAVTNFRGRIFN